MQFNSLDEFLNGIKVISETNKIYIWGICVYGNLLGKLLNKNQISWNGYYDNFNSADKDQLNLKRVYKGDEVNHFEHAYYILSMRNYEAVKKQLLSAGVDSEHIIFFDNVKILDSIEERLDGCPASVGQLKRLNRVHSGERCFIIGNGPSLRVEDLDVIYHAKAASFACNRIFRCYDKSMWRPDYYFITDGVGIRETFPDKAVLDFVSQNCKYIFSRSNGDLAKYANDIDNLILFKYVFSDSEEEFDFSSDCAEKVYIGHTVTYVMLQMAVYMGFKEIYLLGMDHNFSIEHCENGEIAKNAEVEDHSSILGSYMWGVADGIKTTRTYEAAKKYADSHGIKIYNATRGGKLEVFERVDFDKLF